MGLVISTVNMKGGVGKTTLSVNLATCLARYHNKRVLVVDLDTQISATLSMMSPQDFGKNRKEKRTLRHLVYKAIQPNSHRINFGIQDIIQPYVCSVKGLDLLPGDIDLYDEFLVSEMLHDRASQAGNSNFIEVWNDFERQLVRNILQPVINSYDFIILDCAPGYNLLTRSGIAASDYYILPARPEPLSVVGIQLLERRIKKLKESHGKNDLEKLRLLGIVFIMSGNLLTGRYYQQVMQRVAQDFSPPKIFKTRIPVDVNVSKAVDSFMPVVMTNPNSAGSKAFIKATQEMLQKLQAGAIETDENNPFNLASLE